MEQLGAQLEKAKTDVSLQKESTAQQGESLTRERERCTDLTARLTALEDEQRETSIQLSSAEARAENLEHNVSKGRLFFFFLTGKGRVNGGRNMGVGGEKKEHV